MCVYIKQRERGEKRERERKRIKLETGEFVKYATIQGI